MAQIKQLLLEAETILASAKIENPKLDAQLLLSELLQISRTELLLNSEITLEQATIFNEQIQQRCNHRPIQYITGVAYFRYLTLRVGEGVLIPRPETEELVSGVIEKINAADRPITLIDLGSGSGAIALAVAYEIPDVKVIAVEKSDDALLWLRKNKDLIAPHVEVISADVKDFVVAKKVDFVTANPPYLPDAEMLPKDVEDFEPAAALRGGADGMEIPSQFMLCAARVLKNGWFFAIEHGELQGELIKIALNYYFKEVVVHYDLTGRPRWTSAIRNDLEVSN
jgi:release factor glutamine methyltransferase